jgi:hypothetical protein
MVLILHLLYCHTFALFVIPAKAGIQKPRYYWIPAFAGMTSEYYKIIYISNSYKKVRPYRYCKVKAYMTAFYFTYERVFVFMEGLNKALAM